MTNPTPANGRPFAERVATRLLYPTAHPRTSVLRAAVADKVVLVTGASHGIGKAVAREMAAAGAIVLLVARSLEDLEAVAAQITEAGGIAHVYHADLTDMEATDELGRDLLDVFGHVDVVINNAGRSIRRPVDQSYDRFHDFTRTIDVNYLGPVRLLLTLLPSMRERRSGHIVNVSSWGLRSRRRRAGRRTPRPRRPSTHGCGRSRPRSPRTTSPPPRSTCPSCTPA